MSAGDTDKKLGYCTFCGTQLGPFDEYLGCPKRPRNGDYDQHEMKWYEKPRRRDEKPTNK
jgi:hypothetical protein